MSIILSNTEKWTNEWEEGIIFTKIIWNSLEEIFNWFYIPWSLRFIFTLTVISNGWIAGNFSNSSTFYSVWRANYEFVIRTFFPGFSSVHNSSWECFNGRWLSWVELETDVYNINTSDGNKPISLYHHKQLFWDLWEKKNCKPYWGVKSFQLNMFFSTEIISFQFNVHSKNE